MKAIVFDLDGTLIDSAPDIHQAANRMLATLNLEPLDLATITSFIGNGLPKLVERVMRTRNINEGRHAELTQVTLDFYNQASSDLTVPYPNMVAALEAFAEAGYVMGVCTNKPVAPAIDILEALDMMKFFKVVIGGDSLPVKKPDPAPLQKCFDDLGATERLYVGDSEVDAATADRAGIDFALFTEGYRKVPVEELPYLSKFDDFAALPGIAEDAFRAVTA
ncbi:phosphoglycolate phosphatase [Alisedimentitalea sp. MJ-SS2]|uniref:phosphoglycolate phosphatase n=1 Tax=Aliisedimentitalea sp. MJ-SS2 TaxID=3049795 RepID=UPI0029089D73|nr:phosphoglycolate phosphatase [Alisedimentitalea sp. MJ-SS2]MDU8928152.1 phosphoglycolate phosphatase [Alisedimentitalea sp. MJ-SS2]